MQRPVSRPPPRPKPIGDRSKPIGDRSKPIGDRLKPIPSNRGSPPDKEYLLWHTVRAPFHRLTCAPSHRHQWERFDYDMAGCLMCGTLHKCEGYPGVSVAKGGCTCPLETCEDGSICCTTTGYCFPVVRCAATEYTDTCEAGGMHVDEVSVRQVLRMERVVGGVHVAVREFMLGTKSVQWRRQYRATLLADAERTLVRMYTRRRRSLSDGTLNVPTLFANVLHALRPRPCVVPSDAFVDMCSERVAWCITDLYRQNTGKIHLEQLTVGLLYLMVQGVSYKGNTWLEPLPALQWMLPPVTVICKTYGMSSKLLCNTENEVKLALRKRGGIL